MKDSDKIPPNAIDIEQSVLGACFIEQEAAITVFEQLTVEDFYKEAHRIILSHLRALFDEGKKYDMLSIESSLRDQGQLKKIGGAGYLAELTRRVSSATYVEDHCAILKEKTLRRRIIEETQRAENMAYDETLDTYDVADEIQSRIGGAINQEAMSTTHEPQAVIEDALEHFISIQGAEGGVTGIPTGLDLDGLTAGWQDSNFIVVAARPSMGKTAFALHCLKKAAAERGNVALLSLETSYRSIGQRLIIAEAGIDGQRARSGRLTDEELTRAHDAAARLLDMGIIVDDKTALSASALKAKAKCLKAKYNVQMIAIDFIQLMTSSKNVREQQEAEISRTCKLTCKELDIPVLGLSQLNRGCEKRDGLNIRPRLSDLRESGAIEQDADVVLSLFRPEYYDINEYPETEPRKWQDVSTKNICELIVNKQKDGPTGHVRQIFELETMQFYNYAERADHQDKKNRTNAHSPF